MIDIVKKDYIVVTALFNTEDDEIDYDALGIKKNESDGTNLEAITRVIFTDHIMAFGPSVYQGVQTVYMRDGGTFLVKADTEGDIIDMIYDGI